MPARRASLAFARRFAAVTLLALVAFLASTAYADPCAGDDCAGADCHLLCVDGCTTVPVATLQRFAPPLVPLPEALAEAKPLRHTPPTLEGIDRPPRGRA